VTFRRVIALALAGLVLTLSGAFARTPSTSPAWAAGAGEGLPVAALTTTGDGHASVHPGDRAGASPCVLRADCGGGWALGAGGLLLAVVVAMPSIGGRALVTPLLTALRSLLSRLADGRLFHPPQFA
jgi:hypothetical protein